MHLTALAAALALAADPTTSACRNGALASSDVAPAATLAEYPTEKLHRPLALPARAWALGASGVYSGRTGAAGTAHAAGATLDVAVSPLCNLEVGLETAHVLTPVLPLTSVAPRIALALTDSTAVSLIANLRLQPTGYGARYAGVWLGAPVRLRLAEWVGVVGLERLAGLEVLWGEPIGSAAGFTLSLPAGVLIQPSRRLSLEARLRPVVAVLPLALSRLEVEAELLFVPVHWLDVILAGYVWPASPVTQVIASAGVRLRL
ncbi:MAG: hypothetical protein ACYC8T_19455 [Myxococcaceae bacterium]